MQACPSLLLQCDVQGRAADEWIREKCRACQSRNVEQGVTMFYASASSRSMTNGWQLELNFCSI